MQAFILCGGMGTRLRAIIHDKPKPMAEIAGKPFLEYLLCYFRRYGFTDFIVSTGYRADQFSQYFGDGGSRGVTIGYSHETEPLDTGGALKLAEPLFTEDSVLVCNGDSIFDADLTKLQQAHRATRALVTIALARVQDAGRYGAVTMDEAGHITAFNEKGASGPGMVNGGIYVVNKAVLSDMPGGQPISLERDVFPALVGKGLYGVSFDGYMADIGTPESYRQVCDSPERLLRTAGCRDHHEV